MIQYTLGIAKPHHQYIQFSGEFEHDGSEYFSLQLPAWRPGRYEIGNFAKNVRSFKVTDSSGNPLTFIKTTKDRWLINAKGQSQVIAHYEYYSTDLNAGSTFLNEETLYVNPVNCFMYRPGREEVDSFKVTLKVPEDYLLASPLNMDSNSKVFVAKNVHELLDSPFICSAGLQHHSFKVQHCNFHLWINGTHELEVNQIEKDFTPFCNAQINDFEGIPVDDYLFLFHFLAEQSYHGVEHEKCTVITLGPAEKLLTRAFYEELLGVSSHELYHTWNVKALRPKEMLPYNYTEENYSQLGYVYEGVTTYMGDWYLLNSGVFDFETYSRHFSSYLNRHFHNAGRKNYSVAESSYDTWLDGYVAGAPGRKVSIYTEGCIVAFLCDLRILEATEGKKNLATAMNLIWHKYGRTGIGYTAENYFQALEETAGRTFDDIKEQLLYGSSDFLTFLNKSLPICGLDIEFNKHKSAFTAHTGIKAAALPSGVLKILDVEVGSEGDKQGIHIGDLISHINGLSDNLSRLIKTIDYSTELVLIVNHRGNGTEVTLKPTNGRYYQEAKLIKLEKASEKQSQLFKQWSGDK
ncbi:MAG: M61 family metallopeptidase [Flavobacteriales bacterium]